MLGYKFRRQHALLNYIVDFYCIPAIEIDGSSHDESKFDYDILQ
jgi:very-short-patch-repair endonuclease